jgi:hypothetical protein
LVPWWYIFYEEGKSWDLTAWFTMLQFQPPA